MNDASLLKLLKCIDTANPPNCLHDTVSHPFDSRKSVDIGLVQEHRFAFYYWMKSAIEDLKKMGKCTFEDYSPPDLISMDSHDDFGCPDDTDASILCALDASSDVELALFCWAGLRLLNDGHIRPAVVLNAVGNVYIVQRHRDDDDDELEEAVVDRYGYQHEVRYFRTASDLAQAFDGGSKSGVIWDVDMDYFASSPGAQNVEMMCGEAIKQHVSYQREWMPPILQNLKAITVAMEPMYCGGFSSSFAAFKAWESALFDAPLFDWYTSSVRWKPLDERSGDNR